MLRASPPRRRRDEANPFRLALLHLRGAMDWSQQDAAARLGVSKRSISNWEQAYWLPPFKQRLHVVLALRDAPPEHVLAVADALGVSVDPAVAPLLKPFRDALDAESAEPAPPPPPPAPPPEPPRPRPAPEALRGVVDTVVREAADGMNVAANELRQAIARTLAACAELGGTLEETRAAVAVKEKKGAKG